VRKFLKFSAVFSMTVLFVFGCSDKRKFFPQAITGILDLRPDSGKQEIWNFHKDGILKLDGDWEFYWSKFCLSGDFSATGTILPKSDFIKVPGAWNGLFIHNRDKSLADKIDGEGFATFRLKIFADDFSGLSIKIPYINTAYNFYINGKLATSVGKAGSSFSESSPALKSVVVKIPEGIGGELELIFQVSNFFHNKGGIRNSIRLGIDKDISDLREKNLFFDSFLSGSLLIMGFYHFGLFILRKKDRSPLLFGILCVMVAMRTLLTSENFWYNLFSEFPYEIGVKLEYIPFYIGPAVFAVYLNIIFPKDKILLLSRIFLAVSGFLTLIVILFPVKFFSQTLLFMEVVFVAGMIYIGYMMLQAIRYNREGAKSFAIGIFVMAICIVNDILYSNQLIQTGYYGPMGLFLFVFSQAFLLSIRTSKAFHQVEELSGDLEKKITERTKELLESKQIAEAEKQKSETLLGKIRKDLQVARSIQRAILPLEISNKNIKVYARYLPMTEVGGDIYHVEEIRPDFIRIFIADATGHGMQAALITMCILADYLNIKEANVGPSEILKSINNQFCNRYSSLSSYFTCMIADIDFTRRRVEFASAGHPTQIFFHQDSIQYIHRTGRLIGLSPNADYHSVEVEFSKGDKIFLFTDGLFEEFNSSKEEFGEERIYKIISRNFRLPVEEIMGIILSDLDGFIEGCDKRDDITFLGLEFNS